MFGNRLGWGISAVIVMFAAFLAYLIYQAASVTPPTGWVQKTVRPLTAPGGADALVAGASEPRDAGELYHRAIDDFVANQSAYDSLSAAKEFDPAAVAARPGVAAVIDATHCATMNLFAANPQEIVLYDSDKPPLDAIHQVGKVVARLGLLSAPRDPAAAARYYEAAFALGMKLYGERVVFDELSAGEDLMGTGAAGMKSLAQRAKNTARVQAINAFETDRLNDYQTKVQPVWEVLSSIDEGTIATYAGDVFVLAGDRNADRLWRVESTLKLGRLEYLAGRRGDQLAARRVLREMSQDSTDDPAVKIAAEQARSLTIEQYRNLR